MNKVWEWSTRTVEAGVHMDWSESPWLALFRLWARWSAHLVFTRSASCCVLQYSCISACVMWICSVDEVLNGRKSLCCISNSDSFVHTRVRRAWLYYAPAAACWILLSWLQGLHSVSDMTCCFDSMNTFALSVSRLIIMIIIEFL